MSLKELFLSAPDSQICKSVMPTIEEWDYEPTAIQILKTLDNIVFSGGASDFVVNALDEAMNYALENEGKTFDQIISMATWRDS